MTLIGFGADVHATVSDTDRKRLLVRIKPIHAAAKYGLVDVVSHLVEHFPTMLNERDGGGRTALAMALKKGHTGLALYLIDADADLQNVGPGLRHAIHVAAKFGLLS